MGQQIRQLRSGHASNLWLSMLVDAMKKAERAEIRAKSCERSVLQAVKLQLGRPVPAYPSYGSDFSLRN